MNADQLRGYLAALDDLSGVAHRAATLDYVRGWLAGRVASLAQAETDLGLVDWNDLDRGGEADG